MALLEDLHAYLSGVYPELSGQLYLASLPDAPDAATALSESAGLGPPRLMGSPLPVFDHHRLQARSRARFYRDARSAAFKVYRALEAVVDTALVSGGAIYYRIAAVQAPFPTGRDESGRCLFTANFDVWREPIDG